MDPIDDVPGRAADANPYDRAGHPLLSDGTLAPFLWRDIGEPDLAHFYGDAEGGAHHAASTRPYVTKYPPEVAGLDDLVEIQKQVMAGYSLAAPDPANGSYVFRGVVVAGSRRMIVDVPIDRYGTPNTQYPVCGDGVRVNNARGEDAGAVPFDARYLRELKPLR